MTSDGYNFASLTCTLWPSYFQHSKKSLATTSRQLLPDKFSQHEMMLTLSPTISGEKKLEACMRISRRRSLFNRSSCVACQLCQPHTLLKTTGCFLRTIHFLDVKQNNCNQTNEFFIYKGKKWYLSGPTDNFTRRLRQIKTGLFWTELMNK